MNDDLSGGTAGRAVTWWRRPLLQDAGVVALLAGLTALEMRPAFREGEWFVFPFMQPDALGWALFGAMLLALFARRRAPLPAALVVLGASLAYQAFDYIPFAAVDLAALVALYSLAAHEARLPAAAALGGVAAWLLATSVLAPMPLQAQVYVVQLVVFGGAWVLGAVARSQRLATEALEERAALIEREQGRQAEAAVRDERARIARELHDIVAHNVSVVVVQAEAAADAVEDDPAAARRALVAIRDSGRLALTEMRRLLGVLHADAGDDAPEAASSRARSPLPSLGRLDDLLAQVRAAGLPVDLEITGEPRPLPAGVDLSAYRILQEALTNALRHSGASAARVRLAYGADALSLEVLDDGRGDAGGVAPSNGTRAGRGQGQIGMRERVALLGGDLELGPRPEGGYRVGARLPLEPRSP